MKEAYKPIKFPQDELPHDKIIEWWYFNGHLWDEKQNHYAFMYCLFKADVKRVNLPLISSLPLKNVYFEHSMISDIKAKKFYSSIYPICVPLPDNFSRPLIYAHYLTTRPDYSYLDEVKIFHYHLKNTNLDLFFENSKKPLLENQSGFVDLKIDRTSWYYSLSNLKIKGRLKIKNKPVEVSGQGWHDHQWANAPYIDDFWIWFSVQLENKVEIVCFEYGREIKTRLATVIDENGSQTTYPVEITPAGKNWTSPKTKASYPQAWEIKIPQRKIEMVVKSLIRNQEMLYGLINYWEGGMKVQAKIDGKIISGLGFAELVGFPVNKKFRDIYREQFKSELRKNWNKLKKQTYRKLTGIKI
ncbi:MAG: lipocalin-like domain-containing protein [Patescibacteria group bacterium]|jgi:predicted secreted hydrolase